MCNIVSTPLLTLPAATYERHVLAGPEVSAYLNIHIQAGVYKLIMSRKNYVYILGQIICINTICQQEPLQLWIYLMWRSSYFSFGS